MTTLDRRSALVRQLKWYFHRNGYVRYQLAQRLADEPYGSYKKGDEVRFSADSWDELLVIRRLLKAAGFRRGRAYRKSNQWRQPVYGRTEVARFLDLVGPRKRPN